jgi:hypothetical protein
MLGLKHILHSFAAIYIILLMSVFTLQGPELRPPIVMRSLGRHNTVDYNSAALSLRKIYATFGPRMNALTALMQTNKLRYRINARSTLKIFPRLLYQLLNEITHGRYAYHS